MSGSVILSGARTPIGKMGGALADLSAVDLGGIAIAEALRRAGVAPERVGYVYMGQVLQAGAGQNPARQAAVKGGVPMGVPSTTVNKVCLSSMNAIYLADQMIASGDADIVVAGGMESMTNAPYLAQGVRAGLRMGDATLVDEMLRDGLFCAFDRVPMGAATDHYGERASITRERQDLVAVASHERAAAAQKAGLLAEEIVPVEVQQRRGDPIIVDADEGIRPETTLEVLAALRPTFSAAGTITAGNASQISDGAVALVLASKSVADESDIAPLGEVVSYGQVAGPDPSLLAQPSRAAKRALDRAGLGIGDVDLIEINEAFAAVCVASIDDLGVSHEIVNVNGGAIALGHPIGMSGGRLTLSLLLELRRRGQSVGLAAMCAGGGLGDAIVLRSSLT